MSDQTDKHSQLSNLETALLRYGLSEEKSKIYLYLLQKQVASALEISRELHLGRTKVYRLLSQLQQQGLVVYEIDDRGMKFRSQHPSQLSHMLDQEQAKIQALRSDIPLLVPQLQSLMARNSNHSKVLYYEGEAGLKQLTYNITRTNQLLRVYEMEHLSQFLPNDFSELVRQELVEKKILTKDLTNKEGFTGFTKVSALIEHWSEFRYINPTQLSINFEVLIYNDVYATYTYKGEKYFGIEIYNQQLADMQKQLFDFIWNTAQIMQFTDRFGASKVVK